MIKFKVGDIVCLKSGGPDMTVVECLSINGIDKIKCRWFDKELHMYTETFHPKELDHSVETEYDFIPKKRP